MRGRPARSRVAAAAVVLGGLLAFAVSGSPAVADLSSPGPYQVTIAPSATLQAKGAAVSVPLTVRCPAFTTTSLTVRLTQRIGNSAVSGERFTQVQCTGEDQQVVVNVVAQSGSRTFKNGTAFVEAELFGCTFVCGTMASDSRTVSVRS